MKPSKTLSLSMTRQERSGGLIYLALEMFLLPPVLAALNALLPRPLSPSGLNLLFFSLNFLSTALIFRGFLISSFAQAAWGRILPVAAGALALYLACNFAIGALYSRFFPEFSNVNDKSVALLLEGGFPLMAVGTVALAPPAEELLFRGLLFGGLHRRSPLFAYALSMALFASVHVMGYAGAVSPAILGLCFLQYLPAGLILAGAYREADSIFAPILIHMAVNALGILFVR